MTSTDTATREVMRLLEAGEYGYIESAAQWYWRDIPVHGQSGPVEAKGARGRILRHLFPNGGPVKPAYDAARWGEPLPATSPRDRRLAEVAARPDRFALYRYFNRDAALLYIGKTNDPLGRIEEHIAEQPWAHEIVTILIEDVPPAELGQRERAAIKAERPRYNVQHNTEG